MDFDPARRRFLSLAGASTVMSLAGCPGGQDGTTDNSDIEESPATEATADTNTGTDTTPGTAPVADAARTVGLAVQPNQQQLRQRQQQIQTELEAGNITRREAQQQVQVAQTDLRIQAVSAVRERLQAETDITVTDAIDQVGALLVTGPAPALLDTLAFSEVSALLPEQTFREAKTQAQQAPQSPTPDN